MSLWGCLMGGANLVLHAAGWLGGGLTASFEKLVIDCEMLQMMSAYFDPPVVDIDTLALEAVREVGPAGHFFGAAHTMQRYERAFYSPLVSNWDNYDTWMERGQVTARERANTIWKRMVAEYEQPPIDPGIDEALQGLHGAPQARGRLAAELRRQRLPQRPDLRLQHLEAGCFGVLGRDDGLVEAPFEPQPVDQRDEVAGERRRHRRPCRAARRRRRCLPPARRDRRRRARDALP